MDSQLPSYFLFLALLAGPLQAQPVQAGHAFEAADPIKGPAAAPSVSPGTVQQPYAATPLLPLTKQAAIGACLEKNFDLRAATADVEGNRSAARAAGTTPPAQVTWQANTRFTNYSDNTVMLQQNFLPWGAQEATSRAGQKQLQFSEQQLLQTRLKLIQQVKDAFVELLAAQEREKIAVANAEVAHKSLKLTQARYQAGAAPKMDLLSAEVESQRAVQDRLLAQGQVQMAQDALAPLLGQSATHRLLASGTLSVEALAKFEIDWLLENIDLHPRLSAAQLQLQKAQAQLDVASSQGNPSPGIGVGYDGNNRSPIVVVQLNIPLDWGQLANLVDQKRAAVQQAELQAQSQRLNLESEIRQSWNSYRALWQVAQNYPQAIVAPAERTVEVSSFGYERGAVPYVQLLTYQQRLFQIRRDNLEAQRAAWKSLHALEAVSGKTLEVLP